MLFQMFDRHRREKKPGSARLPLVPNQPAKQEPPSVAEASVTSSHNTPKNLVIPTRERSEAGGTRLSFLRPGNGLGALPPQPVCVRPLVYELHPFFAISAFNISLSRLRSTTSFFNFVFSSRNCFASCASLTSIPPYFAFQA
jgi:hypothetical protein